MTPNQEVQAIQDRYSRRKQLPEASLYSPLLPSVYLGEQEKERAIIHCLKTFTKTPLYEQKLLEIGCGTGGNLIKLMQLGFQPENLVGNELLHDRATVARDRLSQATQILVGDAAQLDLSSESFDIIYQSTVFSSILDPRFQHQLSDRMWDLVKPGGGILWYDFIFNNPKNPDVRGVPVKRVRELFPNANVKVWRVTLAPPISRLVTKVHPVLYPLFNTIPILRSHVVCWIQK
jgi:SAM-dependent methyltransferase